MDVKFERIGSAVLLAFSIFYLVAAFQLPTESPNLADVGPRLYPLILGSLFILLSLLWFLRAYTGSRAEGDCAAVANESDADLATPSIKRVLALLGAGIFFLVALQPLGFLPTAVLFLIASILIIAWERPSIKGVLLAGVVALVAGLALQWLLSDVMAIYLP